MKRELICSTVVPLALILLRCGAGTKGFDPKGIDPSRSLFAGAVLVENDGIDDLYQVRKANITAVFICKVMEAGKETIRSFRVKTDSKGYYLIPNVSPGSWILKGIEVDVGFTRRLLISSRWEGNAQIYFIDQGMIDNTVRVWPPESRGSWLGNRIYYFKVDNAGRVLYREYPSLNGVSLGLKNEVHTMAAPKEYYRGLYPELNVLQ